MNGRRRSGCWIVVGLSVLISVACAAESIVINEIAWSGTAASSSDEWIELHNPTGEPVDLTGWTLAFGATVIHLGAVEGSTREVHRTRLEPGGYFLLERSDDETVGDVEAGVVYTGALSNDGVAIELRNGANEVVDRVDTNEAGWPAGTAGDSEVPYASMERVDPVGGPAVWATNDGIIRSGIDADGNPVNGTPGQENSARVIARFAPRIELISPIVEGAVLSGIVIVEWTASDPDGTSEALGISIEVSVNGGETWEIIVENLANGGSYAWDTALHPDGDEVQLRVIAAAASGYRGIAKSPTLAIRNGGE